MAEQITKNQHYVPRFLLAGFNSSEKSVDKINIFDISQNAFRCNQRTESVFSQNYFYDKDNAIENPTGQLIEAPASERIAAIRNGDLEPLNNEDARLITFICCQHARTVEARQDAVNIVNTHFGEIVSDFSRLNNLNIAKPKEIRIEPKDDDSMRSFTSAVLLIGVLGSLGMQDLRLHLLLNKTQREFVISDHPVARYNWFFKDLKDYRYTSLFAKGVQLFMPISKDLCVCAYDSSVYKYGARTAKFSEIDNVKDVEWLNQMQARSAYSYLAFSGRDQQHYVKDIATRFHGKKIYTRKSKHLYQKEKQNGEIVTGHIGYTTQLRLAEKPSFIKVLKKARQYSSTFQERNPSLSKALYTLIDEAIPDKLYEQPEKQTINNVNMQDLAEQLKNFGRK